MQGNIADFNGNQKPPGSFAAIRRSLYVDADATYAQLAVELGGHPISWPVMGRTAPRWWQFRRRGAEDKINRALAKAKLGPITDAIRAEYYRQAALGQDIFEDAGGYMWRCWAAALGLDYAPALMLYRDIIPSAERLAS